MLMNFCKYFLHPSLYIIFFALGATAALPAGFGMLYFLVALMLVAVVLVYYRLLRAVALAVSFSLGALYLLSFLFLTTPTDQGSGCFVGRVASPVDEYGADKFRFAFSGEAGRIVIETFEGKELGYGDKLEICADSKSAKKLEGGREKYYLANYFSRAVFSSPEIKYLERGRGMRRALFDFSALLERKFYRLWPGDMGVLAKGLLLGGSQDFSAEVGRALKNSGTSHLTAVSGYNVAIITVTIFNLLRLRSKKLAFFGTVGILFAFVILTGLTPSVMRAALMGGAYILSKMLGRPKTTLHFLFLAGFMLLLSNPFMLYNVGFLLSFAATYGLILAGNLSSKIVDNQAGAGKIVLSTLAETTVAQIFVLPILLYYFGQISVLAPFSNLLILPLIPAAMLLEFVALIISFINFYLALLFAKFVEPLLSYILLVIKLFGNSEYAVIKVPGFALTLAVLCYVVLHFGLYIVTWYVRRADKIKSNVIKY